MLYISTYKKLYQKNYFKLFGSKKNYYLFFTSTNNANENGKCQKNLKLFNNKINDYSQYYTYQRTKLHQKNYFKLFGCKKIS